MLEHCVMHHNDYFEVMYAVIARVLFSSCWDILWCIKTNLVWRCQMQWLQEYSFSSCLDILWCIKTNSRIARILFSTWCDLLLWIKTSIICNGCKNTIFWMLENCVMHQKNSMCKLAPHSMLHLHYSSEWCLHLRNSMCHLHYSSKWLVHPRNSMCHLG